MGLGDMGAGESAAAVIDKDYFKIAARLPIESVQALAQPLIGYQRGNNDGDNSILQVLL